MRRIYLLQKSPVATQPKNLGNNPSSETANSRILILLRVQHRRETNPGSFPGFIKRFYSEIPLFLTVFSVFFVGWDLFPAHRAQPRAGARFWGAGEGLGHLRDICDTLPHGWAETDPEGPGEVWEHHLPPARFSSPGCGFLGGSPRAPHSPPAPLWAPVPPAPFGCQVGVPYLGTLSALTALMGLFIKQLN